VVDKFRRLASAGEPLPLERSGRAPIGVVSVDDVAQIMLESPCAGGITVDNLAAESVTVRDVAALARGEERSDTPPVTFSSPFTYRHTVADYLRAPARATHR
jgi:nucleoside-diphosphate-sugar epimerase